MKTITIGRSNVCDIVINEPSISRIHAEIRMNDGHYYFKDVSSNGTTINGKSLINSELEINSNSSILLAHSIPLYWSKIEALLPSSFQPQSTAKTTASVSYTTPYSSNQKQGMFSNAFSVNGRIRRLEYGLTLVIYLLSVSIVGFMFGFILALMGIDPLSYTGLLYVLYIPLIWLGLAQGAKRCHDLNHSGWFQLIPFYAIWMLFVDGQPGANEYGANPKGL